VTAELRDRGVDEEALARIRSPAGLDLGPSSQDEIAVAILAELVAWRHLRPRGSEPLGTPETAIDPICGMVVTVEGAAHTLEHEGTTYYFCGSGCLRKFEAALV
jgi:xanthine dehydrogenase accessory factor